MSRANNAAISAMLVNGCWPGSSARRLQGKQRLISAQMTGQIHVAKHVAIMTGHGKQRLTGAAAAVWAPREELPPPALSADCKKAMISCLRALNCSRTSATRTCSGPVQRSRSSSTQIFTPDCSQFKQEIKCAHISISTCGPDCRCFSLRAFRFLSTASTQ